MSKLCVIHPKRCRESAELLAKHLGCVVDNPYRSDKTDYSRFTIVINYGVSKDVKGLLINKPASVRVCKNKLQTFVKLHAAGVPVPAFTSDTAVLDKKEFKGTIVCHTEKEGMQNKGIVLVEEGDNIPDAYVYTAYFHHKREYRVVVFMGKVIGHYSKVEIEPGEWGLMELIDRNFQDIDKACITAAKALDIDYVGFDVVAQSRSDFRILEANSGPILTEKSAQYIKKFFNK